jgi:hypothetical protein
LAASGGLTGAHFDAGGKIMTIPRPSRTVVGLPDGATDQAPAPDVARALADVTRSLEAAAVQLGRVADGFAGRQAAPPVERLVNIFGDDPFSEATPSANPPVRQTVAVALKGLDNPLLRIAIAGAQPQVARYAPGTDSFRYWIAAEALSRGIALWSELLPQGTTWSAANPLPVRLVAPDDVLNAFYARADGLQFFRGTVGAAEVFTAHSADVVCHELGHAVLDALRPELFNAALHEAAAFHEAFGDISAILCAIELDWMRDTVLEETGGQISGSSRLSRLAESLGWAIRQTRRDSVEADCLRNAANRFAYRRPDQLPSSAPATVLSREPHSLSRVFTGAFFDALTGMFAMDDAPSAARLRQVGREAGRLLVAAVHTAPVAADYFTQVAAAMIQADQALNGGRHRPVLSRAFAQHGILSVASVMGLASAPVPRADGGALAAIAGAVDVGLLHYPDQGPAMSYRLGYGETPDLPAQAVALDGIQIALHLPFAQPVRFAVAPAAVGPVAPEPLPSEAAGRLFLEGLIEQGRVELLPSAPLALRGVVPQARERRSWRVTHKLVAEGDKSVLRRVRFQCCACAAQPLSCLPSC